jgi:hypothetical protein
MIGEAAKLIIEVLKLAPRFIVALGIAAGLLLFATDAFLKRIGLSESIQKYRFVLGLTLVISAALLVVYILLFVLGIIKRWWRKRNWEVRVIKRLQNLTEDEKQILRYFLAHNTRATMLRFDDGVVHGLAHAHIIYQSGSVGNVFEGFPYNITDLAWDYIHVNPAVLRGNTNLYRTDKGRSWRDD